MPGRIQQSFREKQEIPVGTLRSILNQADISLDEWEKL